MMLLTCRNHCVNCVTIISQHKQTDTYDHVVSFASLNSGGHFCTTYQRFKFHIQYIITMVSCSANVSTCFDPYFPFMSASFFSSTPLW